MTGRRLYDALCDAQAKHQNRWAREQADVLTRVPVAWSFLSDAERSVFNGAAAILTPKPRVTKKAGA